MQPPTSPVPPSGSEPPHPAAAPAPGPDRPARAWFVLGAGIAAVVGSFLPWASVSAPFVGTMSVSGVDGTDGWITAALGLLLISYGSLILRGRSVPRAFPALAGLAGLGLFGLGAWKVADLWASESTMRQEMAASAEEDIFGIQRAMSQAVQVRVGMGLWLLTLAGLVGAVTIVLMMLARHREARPTGNADTADNPNG